MSPGNPANEALIEAYDGYMAQATQALEDRSYFHARLVIDARSRMLHSAQFQIMFSADQYSEFIRCALFTMMGEF
jgi:hypothetical protein